MLLWPYSHTTNTPVHPYKPWRNARAQEPEILERLSISLAPGKETAPSSTEDSASLSLALLSFTRLHGSQSIITMKTRNKLTNPGDPSMDMLKGKDMMVEISRQSLVLYKAMRPGNH
ncbi:hypothetical protein QJS10_CPA03g01283 [Acorus calamus]|uniref:Uncharacterized protein n=1 Tax=Acorus calamus TaxID=4465 RepID=A0AAV9F641_ACOCL|nr:hypothetical protein QJS10_CPA03g01283 [Acorus calamus]